MISGEWGTVMFNSLKALSGWCRSDCGPQRRMKAEGVVRDDRSFRSKSREFQCKWTFLFCIVHREKELDGNLLACLIPICVKDKTQRLEWLFYSHHMTPLLMEVMHFWQTRTDADSFMCLTFTYWCCTWASLYYVMIPRVLIPVVPKCRQAELMFVNTLSSGPKRVKSNRTRSQIQ